MEFAQRQRLVRPLGRKKAVSPLPEPANKQNYRGTRDWVAREEKADCETALVWETGAEGKSVRKEGHSLRQMLGEEGKSR